MEIYQVLLFLFVCKVIGYYLPLLVFITIISIYYKHNVIYYILYAYTNINTFYRKISIFLHRGIRYNQVHYYRREENNIQIIEKEELVDCMNTMGNDDIIFLEYDIDNVSYVDIITPIENKDMDSYDLKMISNRSTAYKGTILSGSVTIKDLDDIFLHNETDVTNTIIQLLHNAIDHELPLYIVIKYILYKLDIPGSECSSFHLQLVDNTCDLHNLHNIDNTQHTICIHSENNTIEINT